MYTQAEASQIRREFWTRFGQYMRPVPSARGVSVNWLNYKTGVKGIYFRLDADKDSAAVSIELHMTDQAERMQVYDRFLALKQLLFEYTPDPWAWEPSVIDESGKLISRIGITRETLNIFIQDQWPGIISFLKERILALDRFWSVAQDHFTG